MSVVRFNVLGYRPARNDNWIVSAQLRADGGWAAAQVANLRGSEVIRGLIELGLPAEE